MLDLTAEKCSIRLSEAIERRWSDVESEIPSLEQG